MIQSLVIGNEQDVQYYSTLIKDSQYFGNITKHTLAKSQNIDQEPITAGFNAIFLVSPISDCYPFFTKLLKQKNNIYFVDQHSFSPALLSDLQKLVLESGALCVPEVPMLKHPLVQEFISTNGNYLLFRYSQSIQSKHKTREPILTALSFLSILSPMQIKKINTSTIDTTTDGKPILKIRLKLFDSSIAYIILKIERLESHSILLKTHNGNFSFNLTENYLENTHGKRFICDPVSKSDLIKASIDQFALHIILNTKPQFDTHHYLQVIKTLTKIENILENTF